MLKKRSVPITVFLFNYITSISSKKIKIKTIQYVLQITGYTYELEVEI